MNTPLISVVIPLYNAEAFLPECIDSVRACCDDSIECILVNDGSTDGSYEICRAAVEADRRFHLIDRENSGVSDSRNAGLSAARGEFVLFLDADDYIEASKWPVILSHALSANTDFIAFGYCSLFPSGRKQRELFPIANDSSADPADIYKTLLASPRLNTCWGKLLRRSVIEAHGLRFDTSLITCEDAVFVLDFIEKAKTFLLCNACVLHYRIHNSSIMRRRSLENKLSDFSVLYDRRTAFFDEHPNPSLFKAFYRECFSVLTDLLLEHASGHRQKEIQSACELMLNSPVAIEILSKVEIQDLKLFYKKLEYLWMRHKCSLLMSFYFKVKSLIKVRKDCKNAGTT